MPVPTPVQTLVTFDATINGVPVTGLQFVTALQSPAIGDTVTSIVTVEGTVTSVVSINSQNDAFTEIPNCPCV